MEVITSKLLISIAIFALLFLVHQLGKKTTYTQEKYDRERDAA